MSAGFAPGSLAAGLALLVAVVAGCGGASQPGQGGDRDEVLATVRALSEARDRGDVDGECALLTPRARVRLIADTRRLLLANVQPRTTKEPVTLPRSCVGALLVQGRRAQAPTETTITGAFDRLADARVSITGTHAVVDAVRAPLIASRRVELVRARGRWQIAGTEP